MTHGWLMLRVEHAANTQGWEAAVAAGLEVDSEATDLATATLQCFFFATKGSSS